METQHAIRTQPATPTTPVRGSLLQRACACGTHTPAGGECPACESKKRFGFQAKLTISEPGDIYEQEADRIADQMMAMPTKASTNKSPPHIQRYSESAAGSIAEAPSSVDRVLAGSGRPLEPALRQDMEQRFGYDFSGVRVHTGSAAEQSARDVNAHAYTVGHNIVFGVGQLSPNSYSGRRLLSHELTHVLQQRGDLLSIGAGPRIAARPPTGAAVIARGSWGEKWDAFWGVGPIDALTASTLAKEALAAAGATGLPGLEDGPADAWRHCFWNCNMTHALGYDQAETIATNHEHHGGGRASANQMDLFNNEVGRSCGGTNCDGCCQSALDTGRLRVIDSTGAVVPSTVTARGGPTQPGTSYSGSGYSTLPPTRRPVAPPVREPVWHCFTGRMIVTMADGKEVPLEQVVVGDRLLSYDDVEGRLRACEVIACHTHPPAEYLKVWLQNGQLLEVTANHHVYVSGRWLSAGQLCKGSLVYLNDKRGEGGVILAAVERIEPAEGPAQLFDLTVAGCHNYFVSGVLVHNKNF